MSAIKDEVEAIFDKDDAQRLAVLVANGLPLGYQPPYDGPLETPSDFLLYALSQRAERCALHLLHALDTDEIRARGYELYQDAAFSVPVLDAIAAISPDIPEESHADMVEMCANFGNGDVVRWLNERGIFDGYTHDSEGKSPLAQAADSLRADVVEALIATGVPAGERSGENDDTPLHYASHVMASSSNIEGFRETVDVLLRHGAPIDALSAGGQTPLQMLVAPDERAVPPDGDRLDEAAVYLLDKGANPLPADSLFSASPLWCAAEQWNAALLLAMQERGAGLDTRGASGRSLMHAVVAGLTEGVPGNDAWADNFKAILDPLLAQGLSVNDRDQVGTTPLMVCAGHPAPEVLGALIELGADPSAIDKDGQTVADYVHSAVEDGALTPDQAHANLALLHAANARHAMEQLLGTPLRKVQPV